MSVCVFKTADVMRCVNHALKAKKWQMGMGNEDRMPGPGLFFVHDEGVYLMSNGEPGDALKEELGLYVAYAENCNPKKDEDCWENSRDLVGGSDFSDLLEISPWWLDACSEFEELHIKVDPECLMTRFDSPRKVITV